MSGRNAHARRRCSRHPKPVAAAVAYVEARYRIARGERGLGRARPELSAGGRTAAPRHRGGSFRRGQRQVFSTRGCNAPDCADFAVLRDSRRIVANMKRNTFASHVEVHCGCLESGRRGVRAAAASATVLRPPSGMAHLPPVDRGCGSHDRPRARHRPGRSRYDYPRRLRSRRSASWIPESAPTPLAGEPKTAPQKRSAPRRAGCARCTGACRGLRQRPRRRPTCRKPRPRLPDRVRRATSWRGIRR